LVAIPREDQYTKTGVLELRLKQGVDIAAFKEASPCASRGAARGWVVMPRFSIAKRRGRN
jgi:hypothetical protein